MAKAEFGGGPLAALREFLAGRGAEYQIDRARCDMFGRNVTWTPEGFLRRI